MIVYFDTFAFIPLIIEEPSSESCKRLWNEATRVVSVRLHYAEARAALARAQRLRWLTRGGAYYCCRSARRAHPRNRQRRDHRQSCPKNRCTGRRTGASRLRRRSPSCGDGSCRLGHSLRQQRATTHRRCLPSRTHRDSRHIEEQSEFIAHWEVILSVTPSRACRPMPSNGLPSTISATCG